MDPNYMRLALRWPEDLREKLKQSHQLLKESYLESSQKYVPYNTGINAINGDPQVKNINRNSSNKISKPKNTRTGKKIHKVNAYSNNDVNGMGSNVPGNLDASFENSTVTAEPKINPIFASTEFTRTTLNETAGPKTYAQQSKEIKELRQEISRLIHQREMEKMKQQQYDSRRCLNMKYQWKTSQKFYKTEALGIKPVHIVEDTDIPPNSDKREEEIYKVYKLKKSVKSQPESVEFPKSAILEIKRNANLDFSKLIMVAIDPRARTTNTFYFGYLVGDPLSVYCQHFHNHVLCNSKITFKDENELKHKLARRCRNHLMSSHGVESIVDKEKLLETINPLKSDMLIQILLTKGKLPWDKEKAKKIGSSDDKVGNKKKNKNGDDENIMEEVSTGTTDKAENSPSNIDEGKTKNDEGINTNNIVQMVTGNGDQSSEENEKSNLNLNPNSNSNPNPITIIQERGYLQLSSGGNNHINNIPFNDTNNKNNNTNNIIMNTVATTNTIITDSNSNTDNSTNTFTNPPSGIGINGLMNGTSNDNNNHDNSLRGTSIPIINTTTNTTINNSSSNTDVDKNLVYPSMSSSPFNSNTLQQRDDNDSGFPTIDERGYQINTLFKGT